jgi:hypothetical protein
MSMIDLTLPPPIMKSFYLKELNISKNEISSSFLSKEYPSTFSTAELSISVKDILLENIKSPEDFVRAMVSDYLHTNYDGLTLKKVEESFPEYGI